MAWERFSVGDEAVTCKWPTLSFIYHSMCESGNLIRTHGTMILHDSSHGTTGVFVEV